MTFGRMNNMRRRTYRPDENFHRGRRRRSVDRSAMLDPGRPRRSGIARFIGVIFGLFSRR